jgi:hypothetical protein
MEGSLTIDCKLAAIDAKIDALIQCEERGIMQRQIIENNTIMLAASINKLLIDRNLEPIKFSRRNEDGTHVDTDDALEALSGKNAEERAAMIAADDLKGKGEASD